MYFFNCIKNIFPYQFNVEDSLPNSICKICIDQVNSFVDFRVRCKDTDTWLRHEVVIPNNDHKVYLLFRSQTVLNCTYNYGILIN